MKTLISMDIEAVLGALLAKIEGIVGAAYYAQIEYAEVNDVMRARVTIFLRKGAVDGLLMEAPRTFYGRDFEATFGQLCEWVRSADDRRALRAQAEARQLVGAGEGVAS